MDEIVPNWAKQLIVEVSDLKNQIGGLENQVSINCTKLDNMDKKLDSIVEIVTANGQGIEVLSQRLDKLE